jgi:hypothetical protein
MSVVVNQGAADLNACICAYPRHKVGKARRRIQGRTSRGLSIRTSTSFFSASRFLGHESTYSWNLTPAPTILSIISSDPI